MAFPPSSPLLFSRRVSSFLHSCLLSLQQQDPSSALQTAMIVSPSGKLLAYDSTVPVRTLRTQCSVASSLWALHIASPPSVEAGTNQSLSTNHATAALSHVASPPASVAGASVPTTSSTVTAAPRATSDKTSVPAAPVIADNFVTAGQANRRSSADSKEPITIVAKFDGGTVFAVRPLRCGLLFACATPAPRRLSEVKDGAPDPLSDTMASADPLPSTTASSDSVPTITQSALMPHPLTAVPPIAVGPKTRLPSSNQNFKPLTLSADLAPSTANQSLEPKTSALLYRRTNSREEGPARTAYRAASVAASVVASAAVSTVPAPVPASTPTTTATTTAESRTDNGGHTGSLQTTGTGEGASGADAAQTSGTNAITGTTSTTSITTSVDGDTSPDVQLGTTRSIAATISIVRSQVDELAKLLDEKLGALRLPAENIGVNGLG